MKSAVILTNVDDEQKSAGSACKLPTPKSTIKEMILNQKNTLSKYWFVINNSGVGGGHSWFVW